MIRSLSQPGIRLSVRQIVEIFLMYIRLTFEADISVSLLSVTIPEQQDQPLDKIPYIKRYNEHFQQLACMDSLMIHEHTVHSNPSPDKDQAKEVDGRKSLDRQPAVGNNVTKPQRHVIYRAIAVSSARRIIVVNDV